MNEETVKKTYLSVTIDAQKIYGMCAQALAQTEVGKDTTLHLRFSQDESVGENSPDYKSSLGAVWVNDSKFD